MINKLAKEIHKGNVDRGFYDEPTEIGTRLMLLVSEAAEALEADRKGRHCQVDLKEKVLGHAWDEDFKKEFLDHVKDTFEDELADVLIRLLDLAAYLDVNIEAHTTAKLRFNSLRPYKHGKKY